MTNYSGLNARDLTAIKIIRKYYRRFQDKEMAIRDLREECDLNYEDAETIFKKEISLFSMDINNIHSRVDSIYGFVEGVAEAYHENKHLDKERVKECVLKVLQKKFYASEEEAEQIFYKAIAPEEKEKTLEEQIIERKMEEGYSREYAKKYAEGVMIGE